MYVYATDTRGRCRVELPETKRLQYVTVVVQKTGYAAKRQSWGGRGTVGTALPEQHRMVMVPVEPLGGIVKDEEGSAIAGAQVKIDTRSAWGTHTVMTDAKGRWRFDNLQKGAARVSLWLRHPRSRPDAPSPISVAEPRMSSKYSGVNTCCCLTAIVLR